MNHHLSVKKDSYTSMEDVLLYAKVAEKYTTSAPNIQISGKKLDAVRDYIMEKYPDTLIIPFPVSPTHETWVYENEKFLMISESINTKKQYVFDLYAVDYVVQKEFYDLLKGYEDRSNDLYIGISSYYMSGNSLQDNYLTKSSTDFDKLKNNYYPYLDVNEMFNQFIMSEDNMLVLTGLPGTGKTKMIDMFLHYMLTSGIVRDKLKQERSDRNKSVEVTSYDGMSEDDMLDEVEERIDTMYNHDEIPVAYVKNEQILAMDEFWNRLRSGGFKLVILDDLDYALLPRTQQVTTSEDLSKNTFISHLLSFTDGIFEEGNNTKFIITTNRDVREIDTAVLRKGRTFDILNLRYLTNEEAKKIWLDYELSEELFNERFGHLESIPASDVGAVAKDTLMAIKMSVEVKPYVLEEGISQYKSLQSSKKIGLM